MSLHYVDTSAIVRVYTADEPEHERLRELVLESSEPVVSNVWHRTCGRCTQAQSSRFPSADTHMLRGGARHRR